MDGHVPPTDNFRIACASSQPGTGARTTGSHYSVRNTIGRRTAPTFFWGEETSPRRLQRFADRLILMGDWRDSDRSQMIEETGAFVDIERESYFE